MNVARYLILTVVKAKQYSGHSKVFSFNSRQVKERNQQSSEVKESSEPCKISYFSHSEVKQCSDLSQRYHFKSSELKQHSNRSHRFHFNSIESKTPQ